MKIVKVIKERVYKAGYIVRTEVVDIGLSENITRTVAYNPDGKYIGNSGEAHYLCVKRGIGPQAIGKDTVCTIGFSSKDGKWYGWSHRAIYGFKIGSTCRRGNCQYTPKKGEWTCKTVADARQMAIDYANGVS